MMRLFAITLLLAATMTAQTKQKADAIYINGNVWTGRVAVQNYVGKAGKPVFGKAQAFAVKDGKFIAVGNKNEILKLKDGHTKVVDLGGKFVMPGFNDAHAHMPAGGFLKMSVDLVGTKSLQEMQQRIADRVKTTPPGEWIAGFGWDHTKWTEQVTPTRQDLDKVTGDHPAIFGRVDGHISVANSAALKAAGITRDTAAPNGSAIDKDAQGEPTGILREDPAEELVNKMVPAPTPAQRRKALEYALHDAAQWGITSVQDASEIGSPESNQHSWQDFLTYEELENEGKLTARITNWLPFDADIKTLETHRAHHSAADAMLHTGLLKAYMDGSLGSRTAAMIAPYSDDPKNKGLVRYDQAKLNAMAIERAAAGFQFGFHAIGDEAAEMALNAFAEAERYIREHNATPMKSDQFRYRIEHAQVITPAQFARFRELGVIASMQPNHLLTDLYWAESRIGDDRAKTSYAWKEFLENDGPLQVTLAFGTDYPVEPITPFRGVYSAVTRKSEDGSKTYHPEQALTIDEALRAYTYGSAYAEFAEREKGLIAPDYLADFVVLDRDLTKVAPAEILGTKVLTTVVGGKVVYEGK
jgi:predicted amidohydrolase YtcJ